MKKLKKIFKKSYPELFHLNCDYQLNPFLSHLDWLMIHFHLNRLTNKFEIKIHALVVMNTHIHMLIHSLNKKENYFTSEFLQCIHSTSLDQSLLEPIINLSQYLNTYKYIYRNPVEVGLVKKCQDYYLSSLHSMLGKSDTQYNQVIDPLSIIQNPIQVLRWLNQPYENKFFHSKSVLTNWRTESISDSF